MYNFVHLLPTNTRCWNEFSSPCPKCNIKLLCPSSTQGNPTIVYIFPMFSQLLLFACLQWCWEPLKWSCQPPLHNTKCCPQFVACNVSLHYQGKGSHWWEAKLVPQSQTVSALVRTDTFGYTLIWFDYIFVIVLNITWHSYANHSVDVIPWCMILQYKSPVQSLVSVYVVFMLATKWLTSSLLTYSTPKMVFNEGEENRAW